MNPWESHPGLVHFPIALLITATVLDVVVHVRVRMGLCRSVMRRLLARVSMGLLFVGVLSALVAALAGLVAYLTVPAHTAEAQVRLLVHALLAAGATSLYGVGLFLRRKRPGRVASDGDIALSVAGALFLAAAGALGGYAVYHDGVGVTGPQGAPEGTSVEHFDRLTGGR